MPLIALVSLMLMLPAAALAEVFRCEVEGSWVFTDRPCRANAPIHALPPIGRMPSVAASEDLAEAHDRERELNSRNREAAKQLFLEDYRADQQESAQLESAIQQGRVLLDMKPAEVRRALGPADYFEREGDREYWIYKRGGARSASRQVIVFQNRRVIEQRGGPR